MSKSLYLSKTYVLIALNLEFAPEEKALENTGLTAEMVEELDHVELDSALQMVQNLNRYSETLIWPTILGAHLSVTSHGPLGYATISAPTLGKALSTFLEWGQLRFECYTGRVVEQDDAFEIIISDTTEELDFARFFFECFIRAFEVMTTLVFGKTAKNLTKIYMQRSSDGVKQAMKKEYDSELYFGTQDNKLVIPKDLWFTRSPLYDRDSYELNIRKCQQLLDQRSLSSRPDLAVRSIVSKYFEHSIEGANEPGSPPKLVQIAEQLHMSERTLIRKLKSYNTSYKSILEKERVILSVRLLSEARYTVFDVAELLGYKESANFCRAFKSWYGVSPSAYRRNGL